MAKVEVRSFEGETVRELELADEVFAVAPNRNLMWEAVQAYLASQRRGTHKTRSRGEVSGGGKKPWRQKGTGRARAGSIRSSLWRHGSIAHGPVPRDYAYEVPKKMLRGALRSALAAKYQDHQLTVVDELNPPEPKTKAFTAALKNLGMTRSVLVVNEAAHRNLELCSRNLPGCALMRHHTVHAYDILSHEGLLISERALMRLQEALR
jgi:large subunit ribosomal protein L4